MLKEKNQPQDTPKLGEKKKTINVQKIAVLGMFSAIAYMVIYLRIPLPMFTSFLKYEPKDIIITIAGFIYGPLSAAVISVVVSLIEMITASDTGFIGLVMNILSTCAFACTASWIYHKRRTLKIALIGLVTGAVLSIVIMVLWNYLITPFYMGIPRESVVPLLPGILGFNIFKNVVNIAGIMLIYKPIISALRKSRLLPEREKGQKQTKSKTISVIFISLFILITAILFIFIFQGKL